MLKRIYIDNYKCLVNFELSVNPISLLLGPNGSGKTSVFEALQKLQIVMTGDGKISHIFDPSERTRWQTSPTQTFELDIERDGSIYKYELAIEYDENTQVANVKNERLSYKNDVLFRFKDGEVQLYRDDSSLSSKYPFDSSQSALGSMSPRKDNQKLIWFRDQIKQFAIVQINPTLMYPVSHREERRPQFWLDNYVSWYRYLSQDQGFVFQLTNTLKKVLSGFEYFRFLEAGEQYRELQVFFANSEQKTPAEGFSFKELSDGQRVLIALYTLLHAAQAKGYTLFLDEPENYLALPEIRPWMVDLYDLCNEGKVQAMLISHHPESIDYLLASPIGYWFERQNNLSTRIRPIRADNDGGLPVSDLIARGWLHE